MISSEVRCAADPATVHDLLIDVGTWPVWSPHVSSVSAASTTITAGWHGDTRAFFSPAATTMVVDDVVTGGGYRWHSSEGPWRLDYENLVVPDGTGSVLRFTARLRGPASGLIERLVAPVSAFGQRRRMTRLAELAELIARHRGS